LTFGHFNVLNEVLLFLLLCRVPSSPSALPHLQGRKDALNPVRVATSNTAPAWDLQVSLLPTTSRLLDALYPYNLQEINPTSGALFTGGHDRVANLAVIGSVIGIDFTKNIGGYALARFVASSAITTQK
jgi:hypothetical protein